MFGACGCEGFVEVAEEIGVRGFEGVRLGVGGFLLGVVSGRADVLEGTG